MKKKWIYVLLLSSFCVIAFCVIAVLFRIFSLSELPISFVAAFLEAVITAIITVILLKGQTDAEEVKERNVKVFELKTAVFQSYIDTTWEVWEKMEISAEKYREMTKYFYNNIMLYLPKNSINNMSKYLLELGNCMGKNKSEIYSSLKNCTFSIINELVKNIGLGGSIDINIHSEIEQKMFSLLFKQTILEEMNKSLVYNCIESSPLSIGFFKNTENGEYLFFPFKNQNLFGCYIVIGPFTKNTRYSKDPFISRIMLYMQIPTYREEAARFRTDNINKIFIVCNSDDEISLNDPIEYEIRDSLKYLPKCNEYIPEFSFDDYESINRYKSDYTEIAATLAERAKTKFDLCETEIGNCSIMEVIKELQGISKQQVIDYEDKEIDRKNNEGEYVAPSQMGRQLFYE